MAGQYETNNRRRKRRKGTQWYKIIPVIIASVLGVVCLITVTIAIAAVVQKMNVPTEDGGYMNVTTTAPTQPTTAKPSIEQPQVQELVASAEFVAQGYDYQKAISMLQSYEDYEKIPELAQIVAQYEQQDAQLVTYRSPETVTHIFFHSLIVDPDRAFDGDEDQNGYNMYMTTVDEFKAILNEMYKKGFILISPYDLAYNAGTEEEPNFVYGNIRIPDGKIPFIMSQDDVNYYSYMIGTGNGKNETPVFVDSKNDGFAHKIVIGEDGKPTCEYMDAAGNITTGDYDLVPVLETFIQEHPDFSYHGARAILGMTGYEGVFGYRTKPSYEAAMGSEAYAKEVEDAKAVAQCLRDNGWILASHSYGHPAYGNLTADRVASDSDKWEDTVQSVIGDTDVILYPHGSDIHNWKKYDFTNEKFKALYEDGYRYFFNVDGNQYWNQLGSNYFRGGRRNLDGYRMYHHPEKLKDLFDVELVFDPVRPLPVPSVGGGM